VKYQAETPFDSIESAQEYMALLAEALAEAKQTVESDIEANHGIKAERRVQALRLVLYNLEKLHHYTKSSGRILNDLRSLRRLLLEERNAPAAAPARDASAD